MNSNDNTDRKVVKSDAEWKAQLDTMQYQVARHAATERAFSGKYWDHWAPGQYNCVVSVCRCRSRPRAWSAWAAPAPCSARR